MHLRLTLAFLLQVLAMTAPRACFGAGPELADAYLSVPLACIIVDASDVDFFNSVARPTDIVAAKVEDLELLARVTIGRRMLFVGPRHERNADGSWVAMSDDQLSALTARARQLGATLFGYNLENHFQTHELIERECHVNEVAHGAGMSQIFGPLVGRLMSPGAEAMAKYADAVVVQAQAFQKSTGFESQKVLGIIERLRAANPDAQVHVRGRDLGHGLDHNGGPAPDADRADLDRTRLASSDHAGIVAGAAWLGNLGERAGRGLRHRVWPHGCP